MLVRKRIRRPDLGAAIAALELPDAVFKTCPWQPRELIDTGLRQWLRCCAAALADGQTIGMPSHAVDEAWHGLILCTARYARFCDAAYGDFLHHHPDGEGETDMTAQLDRTIVAWTLVADPDEACVLWDLDARVGAQPGWGIPADRVTAVSERARALRAP